MEGHCISERLAKHLLIQLLINITVILVKKLLKNLTISTIYVLLETNLVKKNTECFKYLWELKEEVINQSINYDIALKLQKYVCNSRRWYLCICEKVLILRADAIPIVLLSKRDNLVSKCRHLI